MQAVFYGVGAAVIGIIAISAYKLTCKTIGNDWLLWAHLSRRAPPAPSSPSLRSSGSSSPPASSCGSCERRRFQAQPISTAAIRSSRSWPSGPRHRPMRPALANRSLLRQSRRLRLRQRPGDRAVSLWRRRQGVSLAHRPPVPRRRRRRHDHARPGRHHRRLHRLPGRRLRRARPSPPSPRSCRATCSPSSPPPTSRNTASARASSPSSTASPPPRSAPSAAPSSS